MGVHQSGFGLRALHMIPCNLPQPPPEPAFVINKHFVDVEMQISLFICASVFLGAVKCLQHQQFGANLN